ncbi:MAG: 3'(2'),5'-bisphosphate nucleotidase CysQ [Sphingomonadales bacterium]
MPSSRDAGKYFVLNDDALASLRGVFLDIVREGGAVAERFFHTGAKAWDKGGKLGPVTEADLAVDALLKDRLTAALPEAAWLSEETADDPVRLGARYVWIVDPIDGTRAFVKKRPYFTVAAALVEDGVPVLGAVFAPMLNEMFEARKGHGARLNGVPIHVGRRTQIAGSRLLAYHQLLKSARWRKPWPEVELGMFNSIAYRIALVADGRFDGCLSLNPKSDWDVAAADLILAEAGGVLSGNDGARFVYNRKRPLHPNIVAANPAFHAGLLDKVRDYNPGR